MWARRAAKARTPILVVAAALCGAVISAAVLVGFWGRETRSRRAVEVKLAKSQDRVKALSTANTKLRLRADANAEAAASLAQSYRRLRAQARALMDENGRLVASAGNLHGRGGSLQTRAASVSKQAATLGNDVIAAVRYITNTSLGALDPAYLKAQLDYLEPAVANIRSAADSLGAEAGSYATAVDGFAVQAEAYAAAVRRLARTSG